MKSTDYKNREVSVRGKNGNLYSPKCEVLEVIGRTKLKVRDIFKGEGWSEYAQTYVGVRMKTGWSRSENYGYGNEFTVHINDVELLKEEA